MRILIYGLNFEPEWVGSGKFTGELAHFLAHNGHEVRVVTAPPYYPAWQVQSSYSCWRYQREKRGSIEVIRCPLWVPSSPSGFTRLLHLLSFALSSAPAVFAQAGWRPEIVLAIAPTIASAPAAWLGARLFGCPAWLHLQDFELDAALKLQVAPLLRLPGRLLEGLERWLLQRFDRVSTISARMLERLQQKGLPVQKTLLLPNWVDCQKIYPRETPSPVRQEWGIMEDQVLVLYAGSMGEKQGLALLIQAARKLQQHTHIRFVLCGDGSARPALEAQAQGLNNLRFEPLQPAEKLNDLLNAADIHALIQRATAADLVMPSKLAGMLASARLVIATAEQGTELARVISQVGALVPPENLDALCAAILHLADQPEHRQEMGRQGRQYALEHYDQQRILSEWEQALQQAIRAQKHKV